MRSIFAQVRAAHCQSWFRVVLSDRSELRNEDDIGAWLVAGRPELVESWLA